MKNFIPFITFLFLVLTFVWLLSLLAHVVFDPEWEKVKKVDRSRIAKAGEKI